jgi:DNA gyrase subunit A
MIISDKGQVIRTKISGISLMGRTTQGVRLIKLKEGENVVAVEKILDPDEDLEATLSGEASEAPKSTEE